MAWLRRSAIIVVVVVAVIIIDIAHISGRSESTGRLAGHFIGPSLSEPAS